MVEVEKNDRYCLLKHPESDKLLIVCSSADVKSPKFSFWKIAQKMGCHCLYFNSPMTHWYRPGIIGIKNGLDGVCQKIKDIKQLLKIKEVIFTGVSMGGYGAMLYGSLAKADHIIAFSVEPLLGIPGGKTEVTRNQFFPIYPDLRVLDMPKLTLVYGEMDISDTIGAYLISEAFPLATIYGLPYAAHDVVKSLNYRGELIDLLYQLIHHKRVTNKSLLLSKPSSKVYDIALRINNDFHNENFSAVFDYLNNQKQYLSLSPLLEYIYAVCQYKTNSIKEARRSLQIFLSKYKEVPLAWNLLAMCEYQLKNYEKSVKYAEVSISLKPIYSISHMTKAKALSAMGLLEDAYREVLICFQLNPCRSEYINELNRLEKMLRIKKREKMLSEKEFLGYLNALFSNELALITKAV